MMDERREVLRRITQAGQEMGGYDADGGLRRFRERAEAAEREAADRLALLCAVEWGCGGTFCPLCGGRREDALPQRGHAVLCGLYRALAAPPAASGDGAEGER